MEVYLKSEVDREFAENLARVNMADYYQRQGNTWNPEMFANNWETLDNFEVFLNGNRVGVIRFSYTDTTTFLRDFQLV